jgi:hypothetical protein
MLYLPCIQKNWLAFLNDHLQLLPWFSVSGATPTWLQFSLVAKNPPLELFFLGYLV